MATIEQGLLGTVTGRVGPVTSYIRCGRNVIRSAKSTGTVKKTSARLAQREKINVCNEFTSAFTGTGFFNITFPAYGQHGTGYNRATAALMNLAITGAYPGQSLFWQKILIARGPLPGAENVTIVKDSSNNITFTWTDNSGTGTARDTDKVILCAYCPEKRQAIFSLDAGTRINSNAVLHVSAFENKEIVTWISFINLNGDVADSVFAGMV